MPPVNTPITNNQAKTSVTEAMVHTLAKQIIEGQLKDNDRLIESKLCQQFNASRGTVREALLSLQQLKLVDISANKGAKVAALDAGAIRAVFEVASCNFSLIASKAALRITSTEKAELEQNFSRANLAFANQQPLQFMLAFLSIYNTLVQVYANPYSSHLFAQLSPNLQRCIHIQQSTYNSLNSNYLELVEQLQHAIDSQNTALIRSCNDSWLANLCHDTLQSYKRIKQIELAFVKRQAGA